MVVNDDNGRLEIDLPSVLDLPVASELRDTLLDVLSQDTGSEVVLKGAGVERASTACVQVILAASAAFTAAARRLEMDSASDALAATFRHLGLAADLEKLTTN